MHATELIALIPALVMFSLAASITPGPNNILLTYSGANFGIRKTMPHIAGIRAGMTLIHIVMLIGLGQLLVKNPNVHMLFKLLASGYILYLAYKICLSRSTNSTSQDQSRPMSFVEAAIFQLINPKCIATLLSLSTALTLPGELYWPSAILGVLMFNIVALFSGFSWIYFGKVISQKLQNPKHQQYFNYVMASLLLVCLPLIHIS
ncbi:lysine transporter LysE [Pseudoalteromonas luteoviolacea]|uniref:Lysine transporter LysE n=1 Tax=Pseudoalteromonas luteoviolacea TaxID=43657 RepID=A0A1C0TPP4_9GAMM|nr:LysE family translocator [Pseudoalteromonas luteoviolacea]MBQ4811867.1 LysE family translocator [Pseudoalteromonas luteoviolacea]OCQ20904.1 lysine transporter LysE [Pseudoalteromonas luteoviolacea]